MYPRGSTGAPARPSLAHAAAALLAAVIALGCSLDNLVGVRPDGEAAGGGGGSGEAGEAAGSGGSGGSGAAGGFGGSGGVPAGNDAWARGFGDGHDLQEGLAVAIDPACSGDGCVVLAGYFDGEIDFGKGTLSGSDTPGDVDVFVAKLDTDGDALWSLDFGDHGDQRGRAVAVDGFGSVVVTGSFRSEIVLGTTTLAPDKWPDDVFVAKLDAASGAPEWARQYGGKTGVEDNGTQVGESVAISKTGEILVAGSFGGSIELAEVAYDADDSNDAFLLKLDSDGNALWGRAWDGSSVSNNVPVVAVDAQGDVFVTDRFSGGLSLGGACAALPGAGGDDVLVAKFSGATGACIWAKAFGSANHERGRAIAADASGDVYLAAEAWGAINFGGGELPSGMNTGCDVAIARLSGTDGAHVWSLRKAELGDQFPSAVAVDPGASTLYVTGRFKETLTFQPAPPISTNVRVPPIVITRIAPS